MKVLFITHAFARNGGDAAGSPELRLAKALRDEDVEVLILAPGGPGQESEELDGIAIERFAMPRREHAFVVNDAQGDTRRRASCACGVSMDRWITAEEAKVPLSLRGARSEAAPPAPPTTATWPR